MKKRYRYPYKILIDDRDSKYFTNLKVSNRFKYKSDLLKFINKYLVYCEGCVVVFTPTSESNIKKTFLVAYNGFKVSLKRYMIFKKFKHLKF